MYEINSSLNPGLWRQWEGDSSEHGLVHVAMMALPREEQAHIDWEKLGKVMSEGSKTLDTLPTEAKEVYNLDS